MKFTEVACLLHEASWRGAAGEDTKARQDIPDGLFTCRVERIPRRVIAKVEQ